MTVVVGVRHRNGVVLAADTLITLSSGGAIREGRGVKTASLSETVAVAACGACRAMQVIEYGVKITEDSEPRIGVDEHRWAVQAFIPMVQSALAEAGYLHRDVLEDFEHMGNSGLLLAVRNRLFSIGGDFSVSEDLIPWACDGSGWEIASGYLASLGWDDEYADITSRKAEQHAVRACQKAAKLNAYVNGRITTEQTVRLTDDERYLLKEVLAA